MMSAPPDEFNARIINEFRGNGGRVGGIFEGSPLLLLHHRGARSGTSRVTPVGYLIDDGRYVVIASNGGAPTNPGWVHNLAAHPQSTIEVGTDTIEVTACEASGDERDRLYHALVERFPQLSGYDQKAGRLIPVIILTPQKATV